MEPDSRVRTTAMLCHLASFIGYFSVLGFVVAPLVIWMVKRQDHPFIDDQGKEAINFQITVLLMIAISAILAMVLVGVFLLLLVALFHFVFTIVAAVRVRKGVYYRYPVVIRFIK